MEKLNSAAISAGAPKQMSTIDQELENVYLQLSRIEKSVIVCADNFSRFDSTANKVNPDDYFRNQPQCESESYGKDNGNPVQPYVKSGLIMRIAELANFAKNIEERVTQLNENAIVPTAVFFERNI